MLYFMFLSIDMIYFLRPIFYYFLKEINSMRILTIFFCICLLFTACEQKETVQDAKDATSMITPPISEVGIPGGYIKQDVESPEMIQAANKAISLLQDENSGLTLVKLNLAATQVVAGMNYYLEFEAKMGETTNVWKVILFQALDQSYSITKQEKK